MTIGTCVTPVARRRIWKLAAKAMTVDRLSHGRLVVGVGLGDAGSQDFGAVGESTDPQERAATLDEGLEVLAALWSGEPVRQFRATDPDLRSSAGTESVCWVVSGATPGRTAGVCPEGEEHRSDDTVIGRRPEPAPRGSVRTARGHR